MDRWWEDKILSCKSTLEELFDKYVHKDKGSRISDFRRGPYNAFGYNLTEHQIALQIENEGGDATNRFNIITPTSVKFLDQPTWTRF